MAPLQHCLITINGAAPVARPIALAGLMSDMVMALYVGDGATSQLWLFRVALIAGVLPGAAIYRAIGSKD